MDSDDTQQHSGLSEPTGQLLKRAREQKGLSVSAVADAQHLRPAVIQAIEEGNYEQIDSELFLKGYVRTYARQVDLDPDAVIASLDEELEPLRRKRVEAEEANPLVDIERRRRQKRRIAKLFLFLLAVALITFLGLRFMGELDGITDGIADPDAAAQPETSQPTESSTAKVDDDSPDTATGDMTGSVSEPVAEAPVVEDNNPVSEPSDSPEDSGEVADRDEEVVVGSSEVAMSESPVVDDDQAVASQQTSDTVDESRVPVVTSEPEPTFQESAQPTAAVGSGRLEMTFSGECWVQVTDSAGNRLVGSLQRDGDQVNVSGRLPIDVVIGAVDAIESIRFDGQLVDLSGYRVVNNRAEFTLDI